MPLDPVDPDIDIDLVHEDIGTGTGLTRRREDVVIDGDGDFAVVSIVDQYNLDNNQSAATMRELELRRESPWTVVGVSYFMEGNASAGAQAFNTLAEDWEGASAPENTVGDIALVFENQTGSGLFHTQEVYDLNYTWEEFEDLFLLHKIGLKGDGTGTANCYNQTRIYLQKGRAAGGASI